MTRIHSVAGLLPADRPLVSVPPSALHITEHPRPRWSAAVRTLVREVSLAHRGVLLLDELPEFPRSVLESLRQPLEDGVVAVSRVGGHACFRRGSSWSGR